MPQAAASCPAPPSLPPWLQPTWQRLMLAHREGRLGHALMFAGPAGVGKRALVDQLARRLLCRAPTSAGLHCGECAECHLLDAGHHPDLVRLEPETEGAAEIRADQVRHVCRGETLTPTRGPSKLILVTPAEAMNAFAANSLLKTLEEPAPSTVWLLVSEQPGRLPQTVRSRCQQINLAVPARHEALPWLEARLASEAPQHADDALRCLRLAHGAPLRALRLACDDQLGLRSALIEGLFGIAEDANDPIAVAAEWQRYEPVVVVEAAIDCVADLLRLAVAPGEDGWLTNAGELPRLESLAQRLDTAEGHRFLRWLLQTRGTIDAPVNKQLLLEALLVRWASLAGPGRLQGRAG
jgi:DNA polymerase-3 subunit delta'